MPAYATIRENKHRAQTGARVVGFGMVVAANAKITKMQNFYHVQAV